MQSRGAKNFVVFLMFAVFGVVIYFLYGPNSTYELERERLKTAYQNYVQVEATLLSSESNGRIGKGADKLYTIQYKDPQSQTLLLAKEYGRTEAWGHLTDLKIGDRITIYISQDGSSDVVSEKEFNEIMD